jgi:hypothetical protein
MNVHAGAITILLVGITARCLPQTTADMHTFFVQNIGLTDSEVAQIEQGKAVAKVLDSPKPSEVFVFGAIAIKGQPASYVRLARDLNKLRSLPGYLAVRPFSNPPVLSDLSGFEIDADDVNELKKCTPGDCDVQLPAEDIEAFRSKINWSGDNPGTQVNELARKLALDALVAYQQGGNAALGTYRDKKAPAQVSEQFHSLLSRSKVLPAKLPTFYSYLLDYPKASLPDSTSTFYWEKVKFGLKPTLRINQQITAHLMAEHGPVDVVGIKQLYASHYFQTALDLYFCIPRTSSEYYLITVKGSEQAGLTGPKGSVVRKVAVDKTRSSLEKSLQTIKQQLEH